MAKYIDEAVNLNDYFDEATVQATSLSISENLARARYSDYDEQVGSYVDKFTPEQHADIMSGKVDPAEHAYQIARDAQAFKPTSLDDILDGKVKSHKPTIAEELMGESE